MTFIIIIKSISINLSLLELKKKKHLQKLVSTKHFILGEMFPPKRLPESHVSTTVTSLKKPSIGQKPLFSQPIKSCTVQHGEVVQFLAYVSGMPKPEISWFHNSQPVLPTKNIVFHFDEVTNLATLIIVDAYAEHAGQYTCKAVNNVGEATCFATLAIIKEKEVEGNGLDPLNAARISLTSPKSPVWPT